MHSMPGVEGFMYPNEMELQWSILIVLYPFITGLVAGAFILASLQRVFKVEAVKPTYRLALLTAIGRSLPDWMCAITDGMVANMKSLRPASRSFSASAPL